MRATNLASVLRAAGLKVVEVGGWRTRGTPLAGMRGLMWHHTATPASASGNYPSLNVVTNGRPGLPGPLSQLGLGRDGTWYVIASGRANHAGTGNCSWMPANQGNAYCLGIEAEHPGTHGNWPAAQLTSYRRGSAAILKAYGLSSSRIIGHKEWAPSRKIDPAGLNMNNERSQVARYISNPGSGGSNPGGGGSKEWWEMPIPNSEVLKIARAVRDLPADPKDSKSNTIGQHIRSTFNQGTTTRWTVARIETAVNNLAEAVRDVSAHPEGGNSLGQYVRSIFNVVRDNRDANSRLESALDELSAALAELKEND